MGSDEEYLDNLLKSVSGAADERKAMTEEEIAALFSNSETAKVDTPPEESNMDALLDEIMALDDTASDFDADFELNPDSAMEAEFGEAFEMPSDFAFDTDLPTDLEPEVETSLETDFVTNDVPTDDDYDPLLDGTVNNSGIELSLDDAIAVLDARLNAEVSLDDTIASMDNGLEDGFVLKDEEIQALIQRDAELFGDLGDQSDLIDLESLNESVELGTEFIDDSNLVIEDVPDTEVIEQGDMLDIASIFGSDEDLTEGITYETSGFYDDEPAEEEFNPFADMSDIDDLLKAVNWGAKEETETDEFGNPISDEDEFFGDDFAYDETAADMGGFQPSADSIADEFAGDGPVDAIEDYIEDSTEETEIALTDEMPEEATEDAFISDIDLDALGESDDADMAELGALLKMADGEGSAIDLLGEIPDDGPTGVAILHGDEETPKERRLRLKQEKAAERARKKAEKAAKKALKEVEDMPEPKYKKVAVEESEPKEAKKPKEAKQGFLSKIIDVLLEEEEEEQPKKKPTEEVIELDENGVIPEDLENVTKIKEKKVKPKKEKKEKPKKEKKIKPKKEKVIDFEQPAKIRKASIKIVLGFAASVLALVLLGNSIIEPILTKYNAKKAFMEQEYEECYQLLAGQELSEEEQLMLDHAGVVLKINRRIIQHDEYMNYKNRLKAIDILLDAVGNYDDWYQEALNCGAKAEVEAAYARIILLLEGYGVSETQAKTIALMDDVTYTRIVTALSEGESYDEYMQSGTIQGEITDLLPGEMD